MPRKLLILLVSALLVMLVVMTVSAGGPPIAAWNQLNQGLSVASSMEGPLEVVVGKTFGSVEGPADRADVTVVLVPDAARRGQQTLFKSAKTNSGPFRFEKVPPGEYKLFALTEENGDPYLDPEFIQKYENRGAPVSVQGNMITRLDRALPAL